MSTIIEAKRNTVGEAEVLQDAANEILEVLKKHLSWVKRDYKGYHLTSINIDERYGALTLNIIYNPDPTAS